MWAVKPHYSNLHPERKRDQNYLVISVSLNCQWHFCDVIALGIRVDDLIHIIKPQSPAPVKTENVFVSIFRLVLNVKCKGKTEGSNEHIQKRMGDDGIDGERDWWGTVISSMMARACVFNQNNGHMATVGNHGDF